MRVVLADVEAGALEDAAREVGATGAATLAVRTDVSKAADVEALAKATLDRFGAVHVVCNNAGVATSGLTWMYTVADWEWVLGVNLWGVIHGVRVFTPILLSQGGEGHIVNTASLAGLFSGPGQAIYNVSKLGVVTLSETLYHELADDGLAGARLGALSRASSARGIIDAARNRPAALADTAQHPPGYEMDGGDRPPAARVRHRARRHRRSGLRRHPRRALLRPVAPGVEGSDSTADGGHPRRAQSDAAGRAGDTRTTAGECDALSVVRSIRTHTKIERVDPPTPHILNDDVPKISPRRHGDTEASELRSG